MAWICSTWQIERRYRPQTLVTDVRAVNPRLRLQLEINDAMAPDANVLVRRVVVHNLAANEREVRLFWHLDLDIVEQPFATTALYHPDTRTILIYKGHVWFLLGGYSEGEPLGLAQFTTGFRGSYRDAEDGWLNGQAVATGNVDAVGGINCQVPGRGSHTIYYWLLVAPGMEEAIAAHRQVAFRRPERLLDDAAVTMQGWLTAHAVDYQRLPAKLARLYEVSLLVIRSAIGHEGAIIASPDSTIERPSRDTYQYAWPRDGALVAHALDVAGHTEESHRFFRFCAEALSGSVPWLWQKYNPDGSRGSTWHAMFNPQLRAPQMQTQEDETALVIWALAEHAHYCPDGCVERLYTNWARNVADWLATYRRRDGLPRPSFNLWEESYGIWTFTTAAVVAGLNGAAAMAHAYGTEEEESRFRQAAQAIQEATASKLYDEKARRFITGLRIDEQGEHPVSDVDASLFGLWALGGFAPNDPRIVGTMQAIERELWVPTPIGGVARYPNDRYYQRDPALPGNPWIITTLWLAEWYLALGQLPRALELLNWVADRALPSGILPEQVDPHTGEPVSVSPLTWSHSAYALTIHQYLRVGRAAQQA